MIQVKQIEPESTYSLRHRILRPNQTIQECLYPNDFERDAFHLGAYVDGKLISVASFYPENHRAFTESRQFRLRGMATLEAYRKQKAGSALIQRGEAIMSEKKASLWWCNARTSVSDYYRKMGMDSEGGIFDIEPIGPHRLMYKRLGE